MYDFYKGHIVPDFYRTPAEWLEAADSKGYATFYRNAAGDFIIPLKVFELSDLKLTLISDMFPKDAQEYKFTANLRYSSSSVGESPCNGVGLYEVTDLSFAKSETLELGMNITGVDNSNVYYSVSAVKVKVSYDLPEGASLRLRLLNKELGKDSYFDTSVKQQVTYEGEYEVSINDLRGNFIIVFEYKDAYDTVIMSVPYHFIVMP